MHYYTFTVTMKDFLSYFTNTRRIHTFLNIPLNIYTMLIIYDPKFLHKTTHSLFQNSIALLWQRRHVLYNTYWEIYTWFKIYFFSFLFAGKLSLFALLTFTKIGYVDDKRHRWVEIYVAILFSSRIRDAAFQFATTHILFMRQCVECKFSPVGENAHGPHTFEYRRINPYEMSVKTRGNLLTVWEPLSHFIYTLT